MAQRIPIQLHVANALQWLGTLYRNPADALKEHVSNAIDEHLKAKLGCEFGETSASGITLKEGECMGACGDAPVLIVDNKRMCSFMSDEKLDALLEELKR